MNQTILFGSVVVYLLFIIVLGLYFSRREVKDSDDFMIAGRRLPRIVLIGTLLATWVGSGTVIGGASFIYQYGPLASIFFFAGAPLGIIVLYFIADKARSLEKYTVPEMLEIRYGKLTGLLAALIIILAYVGITSYQFIGGGYILNIVTGLPVETGTAITAVIVIILAATGGLFSVAYTDFISSLFIIVGFLLGGSIVLGELGGFSELAAKLPPEKITWTGGLSFVQLLGYFLPLFLLILGDQNMYQRLSAAKNAETAKRSTVGFFFGNILLVFLAILLASSSIVLFPDIPPDTAILHLSMEKMPLIVGIMVLTSSVALTITSGNSYLLSAAGNLVYDFYIRLRGKNLSQSQQLRFHRWVVVGLGFFAYVLGTYFPSVLEAQMYSYTMYGATITPVILASFLWKRVNSAGAIATIITGGAATLFWEMVLDKPFGWNSVLFSFPLSVLALLIFTRFSTPNAETKESH